MSFIVTGIDLPNEGLAINANILSNGDIYVSAFDGKRTHYEVVRDSAIQIPKKHGRLIDAKVFADTINEAIQNGSFITKSIWEWIADAPTILEAEE